MILRPLHLVLVLALLGGCAAVANVTAAGRPLDTYELTPLPAAGAPRGSRHLVVELPTASGALATERIAVKPNAYEVSYLPDARWADPAPEHVQFLLARSIGGTGGFALVSLGDARPDPDWYLDTDLQAFQVQMDAAGAASVVVRLRAVLVDEEDRGILAARTFERRVPAVGTEVAAVVPAFDLAAGAVLRDVTNWTVATAR